MVPKGWVLGCVGDLLIGLESGVSVNGEDRYAQPGEKSVLKVSAVSYGFFDSKASKVIDKNEISRAKTKPRAGQIIVSRSNTESLVGASAYVAKDYQDIFLPDKLWQTVPKPDANMKWLSYVLASEHVRYTLSKLATGTSGSMKNITKGELLTLKILIPPLPEQKKIAKILSSWDKTIAATEKLLANSQQQKKSLIQQLLTGKNRFQEYDNEWSNYFLSQLFDFKKGKGLSKGTLASNGRKCILYGELYTRYGEVITHVVSRTAEKGGFTSKIGDILIPSSTTTTGIDLSNATAILEDQVLLGGDINVLRPKKKINSVFMAYLLTHIKKKDIASRAQGITIIHLYGSDLKTIKVFIPDSITEQEKIVTVLLTFDNEIEILKQKLHHLKQEKKALMQQLLTGKRRVKVEAA
ncbi:restriction endonuclease subunit S [Hafnia alvei]|uniref:restriction endonuclease subunit S n=1 Tax=Hafnia alvei TaxID=569 RepID=UPI00345E7764